MDDTSSRLLLPVLRLNLSQLWEVGHVRFHPPGSAIALVSEARQNAAITRPSWFEAFVNEGVEEFDRCSVAEVMAPEVDEAIRHVTDALALLRLVQRLRHSNVDVRHQTFGLPGQIVSATMHYLNVTAAPSSGWKRVGTLGEWSFTDEDHQAWADEAQFRFVQRALTKPPEDRTSLQRRALTSIDLLNQAWLSWQPDVILLNSVMAIEALLGEEADRMKKYRLARRISYFVCGWPGERHIGGRSACPYMFLPLQRRGALGSEFKALIKDVLDGRSPDSYCSQFFDALDLYDTRNKIVHGGRLHLDLRQVGRMTWYLTTWLITPVLTWFSEHEKGGLTELDAEIAALH